MIEHVVFFELHPNVSSDDEELMISELRSLKHKINGVEYLSVGRDISGRGSPYSVGLVVRLSSLQALNAYRSNSEHLRVNLLVDRCSKSRLVLDYAVNPE